MSRVKVTYVALSKEQVIGRLKQAQANLRRRLPVTMIILYGSYAQGRHTAGSDIDTIVVYEGEKRDDAYKVVMEEVGLPRLEPKIYTENEFKAMKLQSPRFAETIQNEGIVLS
jgi:predicted nucleotidyltransferase